MSYRKLASVAVVILLILQSFYLGWYSGSNHARTILQIDNIQLKGELERERVRNDIMTDIISTGR